MRPKRSKSKGIGPVFRIRMPDFKGMSEMYKKKLEDIGMPDPYPEEYFNFFTMIR